jgi:hypothetical protein
MAARSSRQLICLHAYEEGFFVESPRTCTALFMQDCDVGEQSGQFMARSRNLHLNIAGASIHEPAEVFNHRRVGICLNRWVEGF